MNLGPMGFPPPRPPIVRPLDPTADQTLELWCAQPEWDTRSIEEFSADGGRPEGPPLREVREPGFFQWLIFPEGGWLEFFRWLFRWHSPQRGAYHPAPPIGGTGETDRRGRRIPPWPLNVPPPPPPSTGYLRRSVYPNGEELPPDPRPTLSMAPRQTMIGWTAATRRRSGAGEPFTLRP